MIILQLRNDSLRITQEEKKDILEQAYKQTKSEKDIIEKDGSREHEHPWLKPRLSLLERIVLQGTNI